MSKEDLMGSKEISVLIVEDHYATRDGLTAFLNDEYTCFAAATAEEAIRLLGARYFNLVLTDIHLPGASGLELCRLVHKMHLDSVVLVMTGMSDFEYRARAMGEGALYYIEKPINPEKLLIWMQSALRCQALARGKRRYEEGMRRASAGVKAGA
jgi:DNA-binding NtrC family response regulator